MTRKVHTFTLTFEVSTTKTAAAVKRFIEESASDLECMVEQDLKDSACLESVKVNNPFDLVEFATNPGQSA